MLALFKVSYTSRRIRKCWRIRGYYVAVSKYILRLSLLIVNREDSERCLRWAIRRQVSEMFNWQTKKRSQVRALQQKTHRDGARAIDIPGASAGKTMSLLSELGKSARSEAGEQ